MFCSKARKVGFHTKLDAELDRARIQKNSVKFRRASYRELPIRSYHCPFCGRWHHTSQKERESGETG